MKIVTRFAPSPTGFLHIGGARTALFNWLYARHLGGQFRLRIEDTDRARSTQAAIDAILEGMQWLGLKWDGEVVYQFSRAKRHAEIAHQMVKAGTAYYCYCTQEELADMREKATAEGKIFRYNNKWRDRTPITPPHDKPSIRLKAPLTGETQVRDAVQGIITVPNSDLDDMVLLRSDNTPTYMLAVVVDDHDMGITHIIRGDDHLTNAARQTLIYQALDWEIPNFSHVPMIHGSDGTKLSKRHGALGVEAYRDMGYLPDALRNYLLRLGWSHGDDEIISTKQAIEWFNLESIGKSPSRFDFEKLNSLNGHYIRQMADDELLKLLTPFLKDATEEGLERIQKGLKGLKERGKNLVELARSAEFYIARPALDEKAAATLTPEGKAVLQRLIKFFEAQQVWEAADIEAAIRQFGEAEGLKLGQMGLPLRAALSGSLQSPPIFEMISVFGQQETIARLKSVL